ICTASRNKSSEIIRLDLDPPDLRVDSTYGLFIPSAISLAVPLALMSLSSEVNEKGQDSSDVLASEKMAPRGKLVFGVGLGALVFVPVFKALTGLPPYMGILLGLGVLWVLTDAIHYGESERQKLKVPQALSRIDTQGALFFLGILLSVSSLEAAGILREIANYLDANIPNVELIASAIGVVSAIIDNVPLVAATMGMYDLTSFPQDSEFWQLVAFCAGTGGSMLIIGSAAGVAFMGMEKIDFFWYFRKVSGFAFAGYAAGIAAYLAIQSVHFSIPTTVAQIPFLTGARMLFLSEGSTHADLIAMTQEDYNLDMNTESVELTYSLQQMGPDLPPIHVTSDRQVQNLLEITKTHEIIHLQRQAWTPLDVEEDFVRRLSGSPDDFQEVQTTSR
ncbi:hypothetical protein F2Q68_00017205, partial [Brassica cretica]